MKKYLVDVYLPTIDKHYDVYLPTGKRIAEATILLVALAQSLSSGSYVGAKKPMLLNADTGEPLKTDETVCDAGIRNSSKLILI